MARQHRLLAALTLSAFLVGTAAIAQPAPQNDGLNATLWVQNSIEFKANSVMAFALAKMRLDEALHDTGWTAAPLEQTNAYHNLPPAIIADVDETLMDNSPYQAWTAQTGNEFSPKTWTAFVNSATSLAVPGAVEFLKYAQSKGVKIFYVTNRTAEEEAGTRRNMAALGFPIETAFDNVLTSREKPDWTSAKSTRRAFVAKDHRILLLIGDNYGDFSDEYRGTVAERQKSYEANQWHFGKDWIMVANPQYGSFESAPFKHDFKLSEDERRKAKRAVLQPWNGQ